MLSGIEITMITFFIMVQPQIENYSACQRVQGAGGIMIQLSLICIILLNFRDVQYLKKILIINEIFMFIGMGLIIIGACINANYFRDRGFNISIGFLLMHVYIFTIATSFQLYLWPRNRPNTPSSTHTPIPNTAIAPMNDPVNDPVNQLENQPRLMALTYAELTIQRRTMIIQ